MIVWQKLHASLYTELYYIQTKVHRSQNHCLCEYFMVDVILTFFCEFNLLIKIIQIANYMFIVMNF